MWNATKWLEGDAFHSVMNYRFGDAMFKYFIDENKAISSTELDDLLKRVRNEPGVIKLAAATNRNKFN
jgi:hypothetical protein